MKGLDEPHKDRLTTAMRDLVRVLGDADALRLIGALSGACVSVPKHPKENHPLRMALSPAGFDRLIAEWGGEVLMVPKGDAYLRQMRHGHVRRCRELGLTIDETAVATGYSRRHVINIMGAWANETKKPAPPAAVAVAAPVSRSGRANDPFGLAAPR
jgi:hypothetical protein